MFLKRILPFILLIIILSVGAYFRFYKIREYMTFLGDEGRDMLVVKRIIVDHKITFLGPVTSVGSMYMGPVYYYMMVPFLWIWRLDPVGPSVMVALFSIATILLIFIILKEFFSIEAGLIASFLYAISPLTIIYGKSSWNPNVVPFFSLLLIYSLLKVLVQKKYNWLILGGLTLGILIQLHYVTFMFFLIIPILFYIFKPKPPLKVIFFSIGAFILTYSPFLLFELRHQFVNTQSVIRFILFQKHSNATPVFVSFFSTIFDVLIRLFWRLVVISNAELSKIIIFALAIYFYIYFRKSSVKNTTYHALKLVLICFIAGIISFGLYRGVIYDYYFGSLFALPFILTGICLAFIFKSSKIGKLITLVLILFLTYFNLDKSPLKIEPNNMLKNTQMIARSIYDRTGGKPYNFALIAAMNSDHAYRYFLEIWGNPPVVIENPEVDPSRKSVTDQLFVICEEKVCQPLGHSLWEIAGFGRAEITDQWNPVTVQAFKLVHYNK